MSRLSVYVLLALAVVAMVMSDEEANPTPATTPAPGVLGRQASILEKVKAMSDRMKSFNLRPQSGLGDNSHPHRGFRITDHSVFQNMGARMRQMAERIRTLNQQQEGGEQGENTPENTEASDGQ